MMVQWLEVQAWQMCIACIGVSPQWCHIYGGVDDSPNALTVALSAAHVFQIAWASALHQLEDYLRRQG